MEAAQFFDSVLDVRKTVGNRQGLLGLQRRP